MEKAIGETNRRRQIQLSYNKAHGITPKTIIKNIKDITEQMESKHGKAVNAELDLDILLFKKLAEKDKKMLARIAKQGGSDEEREKLVYDKIIKMKEKEMSRSVKALDFETAAILRDEIIVLRKKKRGQGSNRIGKV